MAKGSIPAHIRDTILRRKNFKVAWNRTLKIMLLLVLLSLLCIFTFLRYSAKYMEENISRSLQHSVEQRKINIDSRLRSLAQLDESLIALIYPYTYSNANLSSQYNEYAELNAILSTYADLENVSNVRLYISDSKVYSHQGGTFFPLSSLFMGANESISSNLANAGVHWLETSLVPLNRKSNNGGRDQANVLTIAHTMRHRSSYDSIACVLMLDIEISKFDDILRSSDDPDCYGYLVNSDGICLASPDQSLLHQTVIPEALAEQLQHDDSGLMIDGNRVYVYRRLDYNDWYIVMNHPASILSASNSAQGNALQIMIFVALIIALALVFILAYNYSVSVTVSRINTSLDALNAGKDAPPEDLPQFLDPLHQLERNADQMVLTVKELMENQYQDRIAIAESQMKSLQAQIKPHFLYNTLDIIKWMILDQKNDEAAQMVNTLSKYLRQSINKGPSIIALREELELSRTYISIMQTRFKHRFTVSFEVEEAALIYQIPKLSLQPLLENALLHGILYCEKPDKELFVRAWVADDSVYIEVEDNGNGINEETVRKLEASTAGYGLSNVRKRLALFSKEQGEFNIFSREGFGTCITIRIPAISADNPIP